MKKINMIMGIVGLGGVALASELKLALSGTIVNPEPTMSITSATWELGSFKVGSAINLIATPLVTLKAPNTTIETLGTMVQLEFSATKINWHGITRLTIESINRNIPEREIPLGGSFVFPTTVKPTSEGITLTPKFTLSGTASSAGSIAETITITATYI